MLCTRVLRERGRARRAGDVIFARAASPADAKTALRIAHRRLHFDIRPEYPAMEAPAAERT